VSVELRCVRDGGVDDLAAGHCGTHLGHAVHRDEPTQWQPAGVLPGMSVSRRNPGSPCMACKDHVNLFLYDGTIVPDPDQIITGGHDNKTARTISFYPDSSIPRRPLTTMLRQIGANNRAGGWRKFKQQP